MDRNGENIYSTEERMDRVFRKATRIQRKRNRIAMPALGVSALVLGLGLVGAIGLFAEPGSSVAVSSLYGSSIMLDGNVGSYILVALLAAALAVVVTLIFVTKSHTHAWEEPAPTLRDDDLIS